MLDYIHLFKNTRLSSLHWRPPEVLQPRYVQWSSTSRAFLPEYYPKTHENTKYEFQLLAWLFWYGAVCEIFLLVSTPNLGAHQPSLAHVID